MKNTALIIGGVSLLVSLLLAFFGRRKQQEAGKLGTYQAVNSLKEIQAGVPVVASGTIQSGSPLLSPLTKRPCVYYSYQVEVESPVRDANGNESWEWKMVGSPSSQRAPFTLQDASNTQIAIDPTGAEIASPVKNQQLGNSGFAQGLLDAALGGLTGAITGGGRERITEQALFVGDPLFVFGQATDAGGALTFHQDKTYPLVLSTKDQQKLVGSERLIGWVLYICAALVLAGGIAVVVLQK